MALVGPDDAAGLEAVPGHARGPALRARGAVSRSPPARRARRWHGRGASPSEPLSVLLEGYERYGPIFTMRLFHSNVVFMLGPAANHYITVSHASNFAWREGHFRDLIGLMGDGLLTIDGDFHRRSRRIMLPAFHREHIAASMEVIVEETEQALEAARARALSSTSTRGRAGSRCASRCGRCSASTPTASEPARSTRPACSRRRCRSTRATTSCASCAAPARRGDACSRPPRQLDALIYAEIAERRSTGRRGGDILSLLLDAEDEDGNTPQRPADPRRGDDADVRRATTRRPRPSRSCSTSLPAIRRSSRGWRAEQDAMLHGRAPRRRHSCSGPSCPSSR